MYMLDTKSYIFCVDTNKYAGNFERQMCAYMTGLYGDCGVGKEHAQMYEEDCLVPLDGLITSKPDEHGTYRPCSIFPTPGWFNTGLGDYYREADFNPLKALDDYNLSVEKEAKRKELITWQGKDKEYSIAEANRYREKQKISSPDFLRRYPAYNSVGIYMSKKPTDYDVIFLKARAKKFTTLKGDKPWEDYTSITIEGFRLLTSETIHHAENI